MPATIECVKCHTPLPVDSKFCMACGADVTDPKGRVERPSGPAKPIPTDDLADRLKKVVGGKYQVKQLLGRGGMGAVFLADDVTLERQVAIKVLPPEMSHDAQLVGRFQREAKTAAKLDHPNIIPIYRVESESGLNYFVMKYVPGRSLDDVLEKEGPLPVEFVRGVLWEAAVALGHAHQRGVVHRDIKPANIMLDEHGRVVLTDFGISKALQAATQFTGTGMIIGTPHYMSPEQGKGAPVDGRADQYSLAVLGYRMLAGHLPFSGDSVHTILYKHIFEEAPPIKTVRQDVPDHVSAAVARAMAKDPGHRFPTMEEFATAIWPERPAAIPAGGGTPLPRGAGGPRTPPPGDLASAATVAAAPTTPLPAAKGRAAPAAPAKKSRAPLFIGLAIVALGGGGAAVLLSGGGESGGPAQPTVARVEVTPATVTLRVGAKLALTATARDTAGKAIPGVTFSWSANSGAVSVDRTGVVTGVASGLAVVEASAGNARAGAAVQVQAAETATGPGPGPGRQTGGPRPPTQQPTQQPPAQQLAELVVNADPWGTVFVDNREIGDTPQSVRVTMGRHIIRVEREGYKTKTETITVDGPNTIRRRYVLEPEGNP